MAEPTDSGTPPSTPASGQTATSAKPPRAPASAAVSTDKTAVAADPVAEEVAPDAVAPVEDVPVETSTTYARITTPFMDHLLISGENGEDDLVIHATPTLIDADKLDKVIYTGKVYDLTVVQCDEDGNEVTG